MLDSAGGSSRPPSQGFERLRKATLQRADPKICPGEWRGLELILGTSFGRAARSFGHGTGTEPPL